MKTIYIKLSGGLLFLLCSFFAHAQTTANYAFTTATTGSLTDMSSGTTQLVASAVDDGVSAVTTIGFDFWMMGVRYTQFSASSNGFVRLGSTVVSGTTYSLASATAALIASFGSDNMTSTTGKVHYKVIGTAPNRILVIEFKGMTVIYDGAGTTADATSQVRLYETTGKIELIYGTVNRNLSMGFNNGMEPQYVGFSTSTTTFATVTTSTDALTTSGVATSNQYTLGAPVTELSSVAEGSRKFYSFIPASTTIPTNLTFTSVTAIAMTLNWTDNSPDETGFAIYRSDDGGITYNYITTTAANAVTYAASGLLQNTNYSWKVFVVRESLGTALTNNQSTAAAGTITSNGTGGGNWSAMATWAGGVVPGAGDNITIKNGDIVTIDMAANAYSLTVGQGISGILQYETVTARTLTVVSNVVISSGATLTSGAGGLTTHILSVGGNITNSGTLNLASGTSAAGLTFTGATNSTFTGTGVTNNLFTLLLSKATIAQVVDVNCTTFSVRGLSTAAVGALLTSGTGTGILKFSGTNGFDGNLWNIAAYSMPATFGLWINNPNFTVNGMNGSSTVLGLFRMTQGTYNIGTTLGNSMGFNAGSNIIVEGGAINSTGRFAVAAAANAITYTQSGGSITVCTIGNVSTTLGNFDLGTSLSSVINMSGGTIIVQLANTAATNPRDYRNQAGTGITGVTGGTLQLGNAASGAAKAFNIAGIVPNLVITNTSAGHGATFLVPSGFNNTSINITINTGNTLNIGNNIFLITGALLTNNGSFTGTGASSRLYWYGLNNIAQTYTGTGIVTAPLTSFDVDNVFGVTLDPSVANLVTARIILFTGSITNANKLTVGNGAATTGTIQIGNTTTPTNAGTFDVAPTFNLGTGGQVVSYLRVTNPRSTGPEINPGRVLTALTVDDNVNTLTLAGGDLAVSTTYTQTNGNINPGTNTLTLGTSAIAAGTLVYTSGTIIGKFKRWITAAIANSDFPVGIASAKRTASINFTTAPATGGTLTAEWITAAGGNNGLPLTEGAINVNTTSQNGYWGIVLGDGLTGGNYTGTFTATGIAGVTDYTQLVLVKRTIGTAPWTLDGIHVTTTGSNAIPVLSRTGMTGFSEFGIGGDALLNPLPVTLLSFTAWRNDQVNVINWSTSQEVNTSHFILERSTDGRNFRAITLVAAAGNSNTVRNYSYIDHDPVIGINYYRLQIVDLDNRIVYSAIKMVNNKGVPDIAVYPNPVRDVLNVTIIADKAGQGNMLITDLAGRIVYKKPITVIEGDNKLLINTIHFATGSYIIKVQMRDDKVVKQFNKL